MSPAAERRFCLGPQPWAIAVRAEGYLFFPPARGKQSLLNGERALRRDAPRARESPRSKVPSANPNFEVGPFLSFPFLSFPFFLFFSFNLTDICGSSIRMRGEPSTWFPRENLVERKEPLIFKSCRARRADTPPPPPSLGPKKKIQGRPRTHF